MPSKKTRERHLAKLAARRAAERRKKRQQRIVAAVVGLLVTAAAGLLLVWAFGGDEPDPSASPSATPTPTATASPTGGLVACGATAPAPPASPRPTFTAPPEMTIDTGQSYTATMVTSCGTVVMELTPSTAPNTVNSIVLLAQQGFFDGLTFHRISRGFVIQGGDPAGDGTGGPGYQTVDAPAEGSLYPRGTVAMAKGGDEPAGTSGSQFFIVTNDDTVLDQPPPQYAIIGTVVSGMEVVDMIAGLAIEGGSNDGAPAQAVYIESITIEEGAPPSPTPTASATASPTTTASPTATTTGSPSPTS